jgi:uncharacterized protein
VAHFLWLVPVGFVVGTFGTLVGAGGGFLLTPILLLVYPHESPEVITSISLAVVFANALSGSIAYRRMRRIDVRSGLVLSLATVPGAVLGALFTYALPRRLFNGLFGGFLLLCAAYLLLRPRPVEAVVPRAGRVRRTLTDASGVTYSWSYNRGVGLAISLGVGFVSSALGIGGGVVHVPALVGLLGFPVHVATATSHFMLAIMAGTGTIAHVAAGAFHHGLRRTLALSIGVLIGAQLGARLSARVHGTWVMRSLAIALAAVGLRILLMAI